MEYVIKKDGTLEDYNEQKIINAVHKAEIRAVTTKLNDNDYATICNEVFNIISNGSYENEDGDVAVTVQELHAIVNKVLNELYPDVGHQYEQYRNYKLDFVAMLDDIYTKEQEQRYIGDVSNANADSTLVTTQRSLSYGLLSEQLYEKFFLTKEELQASKDGYIYIHDKKDRRDTFNCCLFDVESVIKGGFEMGNVWYNEPKSLDTAFDVIGDVTLSASASQYGGFTIAEVDKILAPYAQKTYETQFNKYVSMGIDNESAIKYATQDVRHDMLQGFQGWEYKFNTVASSRGDYPFIAISFGIGTGVWETMASECALLTRKNGQGKEGFKRPVLFPKLTFLYDENLHGEGKELEWLFERALDCSQETMYPDYLSLTGEGYIPSIYKKYGKVISLMGCRASLSPYYERGGMHPADDKDEPYFVGRCNLGVVSLNLPMILQKSRMENKDFYEVLDYYLELIRGLHKRTYAFLANKKASTNPLAYMQGGLRGGHLNANDKIEPILKQMTLSYGFTALNELQELYDEHSLVERQDFALEVMDYINNYVDRIKEEDELLFAVYGTPAESLSGRQVTQFRRKYGIIKNVSDRPYVSNSFHCHVSEDISPILKQDIEHKFWNYANGGKIQYCRYKLGYNREAMKTVIRRAMRLGFYEGVNLALDYCDDCGHKQIDMGDVCPKCGSENLTKIMRMNGYLGFSRVKGKTRFNDAKMAEFADRVSM